jgi:hypothetical protein
MAEKRRERERERARGRERKRGSERESERESERKREGERVRERQEKEGRGDERIQLARAANSIEHEFRILVPDDANKAVINEALRKTHKIESKTPYKSNTISIWCCFYMALLSGGGHQFCVTRDRKMVQVTQNCCTPILGHYILFFRNERLCGNALFVTLTFERLCGNALFVTLTLYDCSRIASTERVSLSPTSASLPKFM